MARIMVCGPPGSGKSTVAALIGKRVGAPVFHLDQRFHDPDWQPRDRAVFSADVARIASLPAWVIDGNYPRTAAPRLAVADTLVYLHVSRVTALTRVLRRTLLHLGRQRDDSAEGCRERFDLAFLRYVWRWERDSGPAVRAMADGFGRRVIRLHSSGDIGALLETFGEGRNNRPGQG